METRGEPRCLLRASVNPTVGLRLENLGRTG